MTHNITLNFDTDLFFVTNAVTSPEIVSKVAYSVEKSAFVDIERTRIIGYVDVSATGEETIATIDGEAAHGELTFFATHTENADGTTFITWDVYDFEDIDLESVPTADIPDAIVDMLLEL